MSAPRIAVTLGDPRGIGAEVVRKTLDDPPITADFVVLGPARLLEGLPNPVPVDGDIEPESDYSPAQAGLITGRAIEAAVRMALASEVDAVVTGPAEKRALHAAGYDFPGQTEMLAFLAGGPPVAMMLASDRLRVVLLTTHIALRDVVTEVTDARIESVAGVTRAALRELWGIADPRIALCGLNPHLGEGGAFGDEDERLLVPAAARLGLAGPYPADTVFVRAMRGEFDAVLAPYHDVGMTAIKVASFGAGVNITLGLPFVRTSPDHGTALDIAGRGVANPSSMREAVSTACQLVSRRGAAPA